MNRRIATTWGWATVIVVAALECVSCGGKYEPAKIESESHFLRYCEDSCPGGLSCIDGVCTESCLIDQENTCSQHAESAICTNESGEPGAVAVCDVPCDNTVNCSGISPSHECYEGYCRAPAISSDGDDSAQPVDPEQALARYPYVQPVSFPEGRNQVSCDLPDGLFDAEGSLRCQLIRAEEPLEGRGQPDCRAPGRAPVTPELAYAVRAFMAGDSCEEADGDCLDWALCEYLQVPVDELWACQNSNEISVDVAPTGFCGLDTNRTDAEGVPDDAPILSVVEALCGAGSRAVRLTGEHTVEDSTISEIWMACEIDPSL